VLGWVESIGRERKLKPRERRGWGQKNVKKKEAMTYHWHPKNKVLKEEENWGSCQTGIENQLGAWPLQQKKIDNSSNNLGAKGFGGQPCWGGNKKVEGMALWERKNRKGGRTTKQASKMESQKK